MTGQYRHSIYPDLRVQVILKANQKTGTLTEGVVQDILTKSAFHPRGIKVRLTTGQVGRVAHICP